MQEFCRAKYKCKKESVTSNTFLLTFVHIIVYIYMYIDLQLYMAVVVRGCLPNCLK